MQKRSLTSDIRTHLITQITSSIVDVCGNLATIIGKIGDESLINAEMSKRQIVSQS
jgi:hypothetical protein